QAKLHAFAEEHGFLDLTRSNARPKVGEVVRVIPNHVCVVVNMVDRMIAVRGDKVVDVLPVAARGRLAWWAGSPPADRPVAQRLCDLNSERKLTLRPETMNTPSPR